MKVSFRFYFISLSVVIFLCTKGVFLLQTQSICNKKNKVLNMQIVTWTHAVGGLCSCLEKGQHPFTLSRKDSVLTETQHRFDQVFHKNEKWRGFKVQKLQQTPQIWVSTFLFQASCLQTPELFFCLFLRVISILSPLTVVLCQYHSFLHLTVFIGSFIVLFSIPHIWTTS